MIEPCWKSRLTTEKLSLSYRSLQYLQSEGSTTQWMQAFCGERYRIEVTQQAWNKPLLSEAKALATASHHYMWTRRVVIYGNETPWMLGRTIIPRMSLRGAFRLVQTLGTRSIGEFLFKQKNLQRSPFVYALANTAWLSQLWPEYSAVLSEPVYLRRSIFWVANKPLLLTEAFLPQLLNAIQ